MLFSLFDIFLYVLVEKYSLIKNIMIVVIQRCVGCRLCVRYNLLKTHSWLLTVHVSVSEFFLMGKMFENISEWFYWTLLISIVIPKKMQWYKATEDIKYLFLCNSYGNILSILGNLESFIFLLWDIVFNYVRIYLYLHWTLEGRIIPECYW